MKIIPDIIQHSSTAYMFHKGLAVCSAVSVEVAVALLTDG